jgi:single-stranded-DNA-specific exonuclease
MLKKKWTFLPDPDSNLVSTFASDINVPASIAKILIRRGVSDRPTAKKFFQPDLTDLHDPFLMKDMDKAVERLLSAIEIKEDIMLFGDYDVDGTCGVSMFHSFLVQFGMKPAVYIPDRFSEGYGLSLKSIEFAALKNVKLMIVIDCGITAADKVEFAKSLGINIIICDHHKPPDIIPDACAVLDPLRAGCGYPFKFLCGTGVAFKLIQAVCLKLGLDHYRSLLDFAAVATSADMVPVTDENRVIVHHGFALIKERPRPCFHTLIKKSGFRLEDLNSTSVAFGLGPRINAVGRLGSGTRAVEFLTSQSTVQAEALASVLESENKNRKKIDSEIYSEAQSLYEASRADGSQEDDVAIVLFNPEWHPGVLGIIASRMVEKYYRPSIILTAFNGAAKGSARSIEGFNIYDALKLCAAECSALVQFGGHSHAAGVEVQLAGLDQFKISFSRIVRGLISRSELGEEILTPEIKIESEVKLSELNPRFVKIIRSFEPFGTGNVNPVFVSGGVQVVGEPRNYNGTNVFRVRNFQNGKPDENVYDCIYYCTDSVEEPGTTEIIRGNFYDIVYSIEENFWNDKLRTQLRLRDIRRCDV